MRPRRWVAVLAAVVAVLLIGRFVAALYVDYRWYESIGRGALDVWRAELADLAALRTVLTIIGGTFYFANFFGVSGSVASLVLPRRLGDLEIGEKVSGRSLLWAAAVIAAASGAAVSLLVDDWMSFDLSQHAPAFGVPEPYTGADLGFFVYWLPFENALYMWALTVLLSATVAVLVLYGLTSGLRWENGRVHTTRHVRRHLTALAAALLMLLAWGHRLDAYALFSDGSGPHGAFSFVDYEIVLRTRFSLAVITSLAALVVLHAGWQGQARLAFWVVTVVFASTLVLRGLIPAVGVRLVDRAELERRNVPFLNNRAYVTQSAFGVTRIVAAPSRYGLASVAALPNATPLWDPVVLGHAIERQRRGEIAADEMGWQPIGGRLSAVLVTRPAPTPASEPAQPRDVEPLSWRVVAVAATASDEAGDPVPLRGVADAPSGRERRLLVFPQATGYAIVSDTTGRLTADPISGLGARLAHAWDQRDFRLLLSDGVDRFDDPAIVLRRGVSERVGAVAPFFAQGHAIAPVVAEDTLYWVCHLYAASTSFPLSQHYTVGAQVWSYFQHAAVAVVNAETGAVTLLADATPGHLGAAWIRRFPTLFASRATLSPALVAALPPPTDGVLIQAWALTQYGGPRDVVPDTVHLPGGDGGDSTIGVAPRALGLLPHPISGTDTPAWTIPLVDSSDRVAGVLVAFGGADPITTWVRADAVGARWREVAERLHGASSQLPAAPSDAEIERGRVRAWPVAGQITFAQTNFLVRPDRGPAIAGVVALLGDSVRTGRTLADALGLARGVDGAGVRDAGPAPVGGARARALYDAMRAALRRGDWAAFGAAFDSLGAAISRVPR
jgi:uncharacterized membrane protein (UPF0182 family)